MFSCKASIWAEARLSARARSHLPWLDRGKRPNACGRRSVDCSPGAGPEVDQGRVSAGGDLEADHAVVAAEGLLAGDQIAVADGRLPLARPAAARHIPAASPSQHLRREEQR